MKIILCVAISCFALIPQSAWAQCTKDTECKGDRICVNGACTSPAPVRAPDGPTPTPGLNPPPPGGAGGVPPTGVPPTTVYPGSPANGPVSPPPPPHRPAVGSGRPGSFALEFGFGVSGCTNDCQDAGFEPGLAQRFSALFRLGRYFALGFHLNTMMLRHEDIDVSIAIMVGPEMRVIAPLHPKVELWGALTGGYIHHNMKGAGGTVYAHGFGLGFGAGLQFYVIRRIAIGVSLWLYTPFFDEQCFDTTGVEGCYDLDIDNPAQDYGLFWMVGPHATFYFGR